MRISVKSPVLVGRTQASYVSVLDRSSAFWSAMPIESLVPLKSRAASVSSVAGPGSAYERITVPLPPSPPSEARLFGRPAPPPPPPSPVVPLPAFVPDSTPPDPPPSKPVPAA